jgi:hypothetical protein
MLQRHGPAFKGQANLSQEVIFRRDYRPRDRPKHRSDMTFFLSLAHLAYILCWDNLNP